MDRKMGKRFGRAADSIDTADEVFGKAKTAWVGYNPATASSYVAVTD